MWIFFTLLIHQYTQISFILESQRTVSSKEAEVYKKQENTIWQLRRPQSSKGYTIRFWDDIKVAQKSKKIGGTLQDHVLKWMPTYSRVSNELAGDTSKPHIKVFAKSETPTKHRSCWHNTHLPLGPADYQIWFWCGIAVPQEAGTIGGTSQHRELRWLPAHSRISKEFNQTC